MDNADLEKLRVNPGKLTPKFKASVTEYSVTIGSSVSEMKLTILTSDSGASYTIKGTDGGGKVAKLAEGQKATVEIIVSAEDGTTTKTYTIAMQRLSSDDATLSELKLSVGTLSPPFSPFIYSYECYLPSSTDALSIQAKTEDEAMKLSMKDGSPVGTLQLNPGRTLAELSVQSVNGQSTTPYFITFIKPRLPLPLQLKKKDERFECAVCCGVVNLPTRIKGGPYVYCQDCLDELTRTNKMDPFTGVKLEEEGWMEKDFNCDIQLGKEEGVCHLPTGKVEAPLHQMGKRLMTERIKITENQEPTETCKDCSKKIPQTDLLLHKELLCTAKSSVQLKKQEVRANPWEKRLVDESIGSNTKELVQKGSEWEGKYLRSLPNPGETPHYAPDEAPLDHLLKAARCYATAVQSSPKDGQIHLALGMVLEEFFYAEDLFGMKKDEEGFGNEEGEAERSSKEEEFLAICKLHGVAASAPVAIQLKAVEVEYHSLKDAGQTHKAEHVQGLHAWKSKKVLQASQGSYAVDMESPLYKARIKYQDAVSVAPSDGTVCYHLGRLCLLLGEKDEARDYLMAALAAKPTLSPARFCLGLVLPATANMHAKNLLVHGLSHYLLEQQVLCETKGEQNKGVLKELHSKTVYRSTNTLIVDGFLHLSSLSGHGHLTTSDCLLISASCVAEAHLQHRASTYDRLLWSSLKARSLLLHLLHQQKDPSTLRHCKQLSALISCSGLSPSPQLREMQLEVFQLGVVLQPSSSEALCHLGNGQLMQYDATNESHWLTDAEISFRCSIEMEGKAILPSLIPDKLVEQKWWKNQQTKSPDKGTLISTSAAAVTKKPTGTVTGKQPLPPANKQQSAGRGGKLTVGAPASSRAQGPGTKSSVPVANTARTTGARKPATERAGIKTPSKTAPGQKPGGTQATGVSGRGTQATGVSGRGKAVATLGDLKAGAGSKKPVAQNAIIQDKDTTTSSSPENKSPPAPPGKAEINKHSYHPRLGLARTLAKTNDAKKQEESHTFYREVISMSPDVHDAYIELGEILAKSDPSGAVDIYAKFPFSDPPTFDDAFLHGEIVRLLMKSENYDNPKLTTSMIAMGKALGIGVLEKQVAILEGKFKSAILKQVYAGVHGKSVDDPELLAFFKFKCWL